MKFKDGELYKCATSEHPMIFKEGEVYPSVKENGEIGILSENKVFWRDIDFITKRMTVQFDLISQDTTKKEFDLNKLGKRELIEYAYLLEDYLDVKEVLDDFIEEHSN